MTDFKDLAIAAPAEYASIETKPSVEEPVYADMGGEEEALYSDPSARELWSLYPIESPHSCTRSRDTRYSDNNSGFQDQYKAQGLFCQLMSTIIECIWYT